MGTARRLWLSLYFPHFPLEVLCRGERVVRPVAVVVGSGTRLSISACNRQAERCGARPGMPLTAAYALVPELLALKEDAHSQSAALQNLAAWNLQFTSFISLVPPDGLLLEIGGSLGLFGGVNSLRAAVQRALNELGYMARLAVAPTPLGAWLLARAGREVSITSAEALGHQLARVPLTCMDLRPHVVTALQAVGLRRFGDCSRQPRDALARRFGSQLLDCLDKALGKRPDPREPYAAPALFERRLVLLTEVWEVEPILFAARRLLLELEGFLAARCSAVQRLNVGLCHRHHSATCLTVALRIPGRDSRHLLRLLQDQLEQLELVAAVEQVEVKAPELLPLMSSPRDLFDRANEHHHTEQALVERLQARLGQQAVRGLCAQAAHRPERAWRYTTPGEAVPSVPKDLPRPLWLLQSPKQLRTLNDEPQLRGRLNLTERPERIESGWWDGHEVARDYYVAVNPTGERFWVFRERRTSSWFLHGVFS